MTHPAVQPIPDGFSTVTPHLICHGALEAMSFYQKAFGAVELTKLIGPDGRLMHGCLRIGNAPVMLADDCVEYGVVGPDGTHPTPVYIHLYVADVDAVMAQAEQAGAKVLMPATEMFWGDRYGQVEDPYGHRWSIATHKQDLTPEQILKASADCQPA